jgi:para-nitrobenzyl esterase
MKRTIWPAWALVFLAACSTPTDEPGLAVAEARPDCTVEVKTAQGTVVGASSISGLTCAYKGIRYAAPPVGDLRFAPPAPPPSFGKAKLGGFGEHCLQKYGIKQMGLNLDLLTEGKEDCLFLNVWRPEGENHPVMVFIHGGAFTIGAGTWGIYDGDLLAQEGVVVVTLNYRLGPLGFLAMPAHVTDGVAGNQGILDQLAALEWVQANIQHFGGDPKNVTVFGESAGGMSVCTLIASPKAAGLFHAAIIESGGCKAVAELATGYAHAASYAVDTGCAGAADPLACMRKIDAVTLMKDMQFDVVVSALEPHVDGDVVPGVPLERIRAGTFNKVPVLAGSNANEVRITALTNPHNQSLKTAPWSEYYRALEATFGAADASALRELYGSANFDTPFDAWFMLKTDYILGCPSFLAAKSLGAAGVDAYHYIFAWNELGALQDTIGTVHGLELFFVFGTYPGLQLTFPNDAVAGAEKLSRQMRRTWATFAKTHAPGAEELGLPAFPKVSAGSMVFDVASQTDAQIKRAACQFWDARLPLGLEHQASGFNDLVSNYTF